MKPRTFFGSASGRRCRPVNESSAFRAKPHDNPVHKHIALRIPPPAARLLWSRAECLKHDHYCFRLNQSSKLRRPHYFSFGRSGWTALDFQSNNGAVRQPPRRRRFSHAGRVRHERLIGCELVDSTAPNGAAVILSGGSPSCQACALKASQLRRLSSIRKAKARELCLIKFRRGDVGLAMPPLLAFQCEGGASRRFADLLVVADSSATFTPGSCRHFLPSIRPFCSLNL